MEIKNDTRLLIVDDEDDIREILQFNLENEGYAVSLAASADIALELMEKQSPFDLILLDVMMPGMSGFKMADHLRKSGNNTPIIFLTAKNTENDMLTGFSIGADDYISKPFSIKEIIARVKSVLKRTQIVSAKSESENVRIEKEDLSIDLLSKTVKIGEEELSLTKTEFNILSLLTESEGRVFSRSEILDKAWKDDGIVLERTVDVHIARLRKKIGKYGNCIINKAGHGYVFQLE